MNIDDDIAKLRSDVMAGDPGSDGGTMAMAVGLLVIIARDCRRIADATEQETKQSVGGGPR